MTLYFAATSTEGDGQARGVRHKQRHGKRPGAGREDDG